MNYLKEIYADILFMFVWCSHLSFFKKEKLKSVSNKITFLVLLLLPCKWWVAGSCRVTISTQQWKKRMVPLLMKQNFMVTSECRILTKCFVFKKTYISYYFNRIKITGFIQNSCMYDTLVFI